VIKNIEYLRGAGPKTGLINLDQPGFLYNCRPLVSTREGLAAIAALPDMFIAKDENFAAFGCDEATGKVQVR